MPRGRSRRLSTGSGLPHSEAMLGQSPASSACPYTKPSLTSRGRSRSCHLAWTIAWATRSRSQGCFMLHCSTDRREARSVLRDIPSLPASPPGASRQRPVAYGEPVPTRPACPPRQRTAVKGDTDQPTQHAHHDNVPRRAGDIGKTNAHMCLAVPCPRTIGDLVFSGTPAGCTLVTAGPHCTSAQPSHTWPNGN